MIYFKKLISTYLDIIFSARVSLFKNPKLYIKSFLSYPFLEHLSLDFYAIQPHQTASINSLSLEKKKKKIKNCEHKPNENDTLSLCLSGPTMRRRFKLLPFCCHFARGAPKSWTFLIISCHPSYEFRIRRTAPHCIVSDSI